MIVVKRPLSNFLTISWREQINFQRDDDEVCFVLDQHIEFDFYSASSLKQKSDSEPTSLHSFSLMLRA